MTNGFVGGAHYFTRGVAGRPVPGYWPSLRRVLVRDIAAATVPTTATPANSAKKPAKNTTIATRTTARSATVNAVPTHTLRSLTHTAS